MTQDLTKEAPHIPPEPPFAFAIARRADDKCFPGTCVRTRAFTIGIPTMSQPNSLKLKFPVQSWLYLALVLAPLIFNICLASRSGTSL